jgi:hypothetical protein
MAAVPPSRWSRAVKPLLFALLVCVEHPRATLRVLGLLCLAFFGLTCSGPDRPEDSPPRTRAASVSMNNSEAPTPRRGTIVLGDFRGLELLADEQHFYWTEVGVHEYDDEPSYITRAVVMRRDHRGGPVETIFDFERDEVRCTPHRPVFIRDDIGWFGTKEWVDGQFDAARFMHRRGDMLHAVPMPGQEADRVTTDGHDLLTVRGREPATLMRIDPVTGDVVEIAALSRELGRLRRLVGTIPGHVVGHSRTNDGDTVWTARLDDGAATIVLSVPRESRINSITTGGRHIAVAWGRSEHRITVIDGGEARTLLEPEHLATGLLIDGPYLYVNYDAKIQRVHLDDGALTPIVDARPTATLALGGGFIYWREGKTLRRHPLP